MAAKDIRGLADELRNLLVRIDDIPSNTPKVAMRKLRADLETAAIDLRSRLNALDPVSQPPAFFDPADPRLFGTFAAVALLGQERVPLSQRAGQRFYGSGVYAIYYSGDFDLYAPISQTETPIYVGKADPAVRAARTPQQQGPQLSSRLEEHRKNIERATNLSVGHFQCRYLPIASGWQAVTESSLIALFNPLWNKEMKVLLGFGKHGDSAETRKNRRSPWDVLHQGRKWAGAEALEDAKSIERIEADVASHFSKHRPIGTIDEVLQILLQHVGAA